VAESAMRSARIAAPLTVFLLLATDPARAAPGVDESPPIGRTAIEMLGGTLGGALGLTVGLVGGPVGAILGLFFSLPLGVMLGGDVAGGSGRYGGALLASALGWGGAFGVAALYDDMNDPTPGDDAMAYAMVWAFPLAAAILGYEATNDADEERAQ